MNEKKSTELDRPKPAIPAGGRVEAIVPFDLDSAYRLAVAITQADMAPKGFDRNANKVMVAIMHGMEVGFTPMAALQSIAIINGQPSIWGDGALALVEASGLLEDITETIEGEGDNRVAVCVVKRRDRSAPTRRTFSVKDAQLAELWGKKSTWKQYPERMLQMRARGFALRDTFASVFRGLHIGEEALDTPHIGPDRAKDVTPARPTKADPQYRPTHPGLTDDHPQDEETDAAAEAGTVAMWEVVSHWGEVTFQTHSPGEWLDEVRHAIQRKSLTADEARQVVDNNRETAEAIANLEVGVMGHTMEAWEAECERLIAAKEQPVDGEKKAEPKRQTKAEPKKGGGNGWSLELKNDDGSVAVLYMDPEQFLAALDEAVKVAVAQSEDAQALWLANMPAINQLLDATEHPARDAWSERLIEVQNRFSKTQREKLV